MCVFVAEQASAALRNVTCAFPTMLVSTVTSAVLVFTNPPRTVFRVSATGTRTPRAPPRFATLRLDTAYGAPTTPPGPGANSALQASLGMPGPITAAGQVSPPLWCSFLMMMKEKGETPLEFHSASFILHLLQSRESEGA